MLLSLRLGIPLHPARTFFWSSLSDVQEVELLKKWLASCEVAFEDGVVCKISGEANEDVVRLLRKIFAPHKLISNKILLEGEDAAALAFCLGYGTTNMVDCTQTATVFEAISLLSGVQVKDKSPTYVGARMGRPEKAKRREMKPLVHVLFPVSLAGGSHRDLLEAAKQGPVFVEMVKTKVSKLQNLHFKGKMLQLRMRHYN